MVDVLALARRIIATPSVTTGGTRELAEWLAREVLGGSDLDVRLQEGTSPRDVNLLARKGPGGEPPILLNSHLDTVSPGEARLWTASGGDPFAASVAGGRLFGLGAADAKLDWLSKAIALLRFHGKPFARPILFVGTFGEESGLRGARRLLDDLGPRPLAAWAGEPSDLELVTRHKGLVVASVTARDPRAPGAAARASRFVVRGRSAHSSTPELGDNAILRALRFVREARLGLATIRGGDAVNKVPSLCEIGVIGSASALPVGVEAEGAERARPLSPRLVTFLAALLSELERLAAQSRREDRSFSPPVSTCSLGRAQGQGDVLSVAFDYRALPGESPARVLAALERFLERERRDLGLDLSLEIERDNPPLDTPADAPPVASSLAILAGLGRSSELRTKAGCTEAGVYSAAGIPSVVVGPGHSEGNVHAPNESIALADLEAAIEFYARLVEEWCR